MPIKVYKPKTPGTRGKISVLKNTLWKGRPLKSLVSSKIQAAGRNNQGCITVSHRGGGNKNLYRKITNKRHQLKGVLQICRLEYDPNRSGFIALVRSEQRQFFYILAPEGIKVGDFVQTHKKAEIKIGNTLPLKHMPNGSLIHNIEIKPGKGGQLVRSAGTEAMLIKKDTKLGMALVKLPSSSYINIPLKCYATLGKVSNVDHQNINLGKAGTTRHLGIRPTVRGVAMNPIDHPHGGGEGRSSGGRPSVTPWGKLTKGKPTRKKKKFIFKKST
uniref:Large ribosomal subunit protein uL2m n=1 Tax=Ancoracysta twista TaxID=2044563 RepID=A0A2H4R8I0_9EUKA|nr:ribosomal protein L2 [Ancoracysta twista]ATY40955.1 ribosomal protein L2 [Ancoracysta twista]